MSPPADRQLPSVAGTVDLEIIDVRHLGRERVICCARMDDVIVDPGPECCADALLEGLGGRVPQKILLTHIHLDHAGAAGALVRRWPDVEVWVHERGAPHVVDPSKLVASATRLYGSDMKRLWGEIVAVPQRNVRVLRGGERIGPWRVEYAPGHAQHHVAYLHEPSGTAFCGDVAGVKIGAGPVLPPTPPPDIDVEAWMSSIAMVEAWEPARLVLTHFGVASDPARHLAELRVNLERFAGLARELDSAAFERVVRGEIEGLSSVEDAASFLQAMPPDTLWSGLDRYWSRRAGGQRP